MKPKLSTILSVITVVLTITLSYHNANTNSTTPPASTAGDPGAGTCANSGCHDVQATFDASKIEIKMDPINPFSMANPMDNSFQFHLDTLYRVLFQVEALVSIEYGFQLCAIDSNGISVGNFLPLGGALTATQTGFSGRQYINHNNSSANPSWTFEWESPSTDPGPVTFYACVVRGVADSIANTIDKVFRSNVTINALPSTTTGVTANAGTDGAICAGNSVQLNASGGTIYTWSPTTGLSNPNIPNPVASPGSTTTYTVTVSDGTTSDTDDVTVTIHAIDVPVIVQNTDSLSVASGFSSYQWYLNGTSISGANANVHVPSTSGSYHVEIVNANACLGVSDTVEVTLTTGVFSLPDHEIRVFPNPIQSTTSVDLELKYVEGDFEIHDITGARILSGKCKDLNAILQRSIAFWSSGIFVLSLHCEKGQLQVKLVKR